MCAYHWLLWAIRRAEENNCANLFNKSASQFVQTLREHAAALGLPSARRLGSHVLRRGMARDIVDAGGSLATLLRVGEWRSAAFVAYLRENHAQDNAISNLVIDHSDSE